MIDAFQMVSSRPAMLASIIHRIMVVIGTATDIGRLIREGATSFGSSGTGQGRIEADLGGKA
jgi:hypothetical protein